MKEENMSENDYYPLIDITKAGNQNGSNQATQKTGKRVKILIALLLLVVAGLSITLFSMRDSYEDQLRWKRREIEKLEQDLEDYQLIVSDYENMVEEYGLQAEELEWLIDEIDCYNLGYASDHFYSDESVIVVQRHEMDRQFYLTAHWYDGGLVELDYDSFDNLPSAEVDFDQDTWNRYTSMTITPHRTGITSVTFSNDVDRETFKVVIIVVE